MKTETTDVKQGIRNIQLKVPADLYKKFKSICVEEETNMRSMLLQLMRDYTERMAFLNMPKEQIEKMYGEAAGEAITETHALGLPTTHVDKNGVYDEYPDGKKVYLEPEP